MTPTPDSALRAYLHRLLRVSRLSAEEQDAILGLARDTVVEECRGDVVRPGETVDHAVLVAEGLLARYDLMRDGARQITAFHVAGDMCDLHSVVAPITGWGIAALSRSVCMRVPHAAVLAVSEKYRGIELAFWRDTTLDASILAKWIANIGRKDSRGRLAHLFCELGLRKEWAGDGDRCRYGLPASQEQIGDAMGLTAIHVNRVLRDLKEDGLLVFNRRTVEIADWDGLVRAADFSPVYLLPSIDGARRSDPALVEAE